MRGVYFAVVNATAPVASITYHIQHNKISRKRKK